MNRTYSRRAMLAAGLATLAGCLGGSDGGDETTTATSTPRTTTTSPTSRETATETTTDHTDVDLPLAENPPPVADSAQTLRDSASTGAGKDSIPSIDDPTFVSPGEAEVAEDDVVFGIATEETIKAYPQPILVWHEIVNDTVDDKSVVITYCPLTGTSLGFERGETTFGVSGKLINNNLVMYDRATDSWWPQVLATAVKGPFEGSALQEFPLVWTRWRRWRMEYPETKVLSRDTGYVRNYGSDPYGSYSPKSRYYSSSDLLYDPLREDDRLHQKDVVVGTRGPAGTVAVDKNEVTFAGVLQAGPYLAVHDQALDAVLLYHNPEGLEAEWDGGNISTPGGSFPPRELPLQQVMAFDAMWFAWAGFYPDTELYP